MGIDKSMHEESPVVVINGTVYQYGRTDNELFEARWGEPPPHDEWLVEHHSYAKDYWCFHSEQEMLDFLDGLPESVKSPFDLNLKPFHARDEWGNVKVIDREGWNAEIARHDKKVKEWRLKLAEKKRQEKAQLPAEPIAERLTRETKQALHAIIDRHVEFVPSQMVFDTPYFGPEFVPDYDLTRQLKLVIKDAIRKYREAVPPPPKEEPQDIPF